MASLELIIKPLQLQYFEKKLNTLSADLSNRELSLHFSGSKGEVVDELTQTAEQLLAIGRSLAQLTKATETALTKARLGFEDMDQLLANAFQSKEG